MVNSLPMMVSSLISTPIFFRFSISASMMMSGRRNSGMPYFSTPPATCNASKTVTATPRRANSPAHARPAGPLPMMAARLVSATAATATWSHPRPIPASATKRSRRPMATGLNLSPTTQVASHCDSCGQTRAPTAGNAARLFAAQAAFGLVERTVQLQTQRDLVEIVCAHFRRLVRHGGALRRNGLDVLGDAQGGRFGNGNRQLARGGATLRRGVAGFRESCELGRFAAEPLHGFLLFTREALLPQLQLVEVDQVAVEIGAVHAGELHFARS